MTNVDETTRSTFHMAFSNCSDTCLAAAHQAYIDRETASVFSIGNISDDPGERKKFWSDLEPAMQYRDGSITLPTDLPATFRHAICNALSTGISKLPDTPPMPVCPLSAWTSRPRCPLRISELNREQSQEISDTIHRPWHQTQDPEHPGKNLIPKRRFPAPSRSFIRAVPPSTAASSSSPHTMSPTRPANDSPQPVPCQSPTPQHRLPR